MRSILDKLKQAEEEKLKLNPHPNVYKKLSEMNYSQARKYLKQLWCTRSEQRELIRRTKSLYENAFDK